MRDRIAEVKRATNETDIVCELNIDGTGKGDIATGIGFFDHMLNSFARHGLFDLTIKAVGDIHVDCHHTIEDVGIVLGNAIKKALGEKEGIARYGHAYVPMDEALAFCAIDLSGRPYLVFDAEFAAPLIGDYDTQMTREFFYALSYSAMMNLHIRCEYGDNDHHKTEAMFKAFARSLRMAAGTDTRIEGTLSTKGSL